MIDAELWQWLIGLECNSLHLSRDDHACNYVTAAQWIDENPEEFQSDSAGEIQAMKDANTIWSLQIYPNTPIGFNWWHSATAEGAILRAKAEFDACSD